MDIISAPRQSGRSTTLILASSMHEGSVIVCPSKLMADYVYMKAKKMGLEIEHPITFDAFCAFRGTNKRYSGYYFDDLDISLKHMAGDANVYGATVEKNEMEEESK